ncbi:MAG: HAMP domain-containing protein [Candidatus Brocadiales bacterium]|nr:HAMP domain-containing protein [Candidatus Brocadiales bacterium]
MKIFWSIKRKLLLFSLCISLVPILIITIVFYLSARGSLEQQINQKMIALAESKTLHVEALLNSIEGRTVDFASDGYIRNKLDIIKPKALLEQDAVTNLNKHIKNNKLLLDPDIAAISILNKAGTVVASTIKSAIGRDFSDHEEYIQITNKELTAFTHHPHFAEYLGIDALEVAAPIASMKSGETIGILINAYKEELINKITSNLKGMGNTGEIVIGMKDGDNVHIINSLKNAFDSSIPLDREAAEPMKLALNGRYGTITGQDYRGIAVVAAYQPVPYIGWGLVAKMDKTEAFGPLKLLSTIAFTLGGISSITATCVCVLFSVNSSRSIKELTDATQKLADEDLNYRIEVNRKDELGVLANSFNDMANKLTGEIEEHKHSKDELSASNKELEAFCYSVSHDLRAPLRSIDGFSKALEIDYVDKLDSHGKDYFQRIQRASRHMSQLINDLLNLSRITRSDLNFELVDLSAMVEKIATDLRNQHPEKKVELIVPREVKAKGDESLLFIALENLISNAWKFTKNTPHARIEFGVNSHDDNEVYFLHDNGAGFEMEYVDKLFAAFQRLHNKREFEGTGIGLATVQRIIHRHGGRIWAEGEVDHGATFYFTLQNV